jgi:hypothetical protein
MTKRIASRDPSIVSLVPHSGVQFVTFGLDIEAKESSRFSRKFIERPQFAEKQPNGRVPLHLLPGYNEADPDAESDYKFQKGDDSYDINRTAALDPFIDEWVPVPILALRPGTNADGFPLMAQGPSNWARVRVATSRKEETGFTHQIVIAFDTQLLTSSDVAGYVGPTEEDARNEQEFMLASRFADLGWFFSNEVVDPDTGQSNNLQQWALEWIKGLFIKFKRRNSKGRSFREDELEHSLEHIARYISLLELLKVSIDLDRVKLIDTVSEEPFAKPVSVDLILDVGNSRTCGILIESFAMEDHVDLGNSMVLQLRDLTRPELIYTEPFDSHVELAQANFGSEEISKTSGRVKAFFWPSLVRVGPEAARFQEEAEGTEAASGMSSPKRYLWDTNSVLQPWKFQPRDYDELGRGPMIDRAARLLMNARGDVLSEVESERALYESLVTRSERASLDEFGLRMTASRSSFFTFMVAEVVAQALSMINNFQVREERKFSDAPRRLNRLILTLPTAMPVREQRIMRSRVSAAVRLVWELMGWENVKSTISRPPEIIVRWDEASCVQFVYLYSEITRKLGGDVPAFLQLTGRKRAFAEADKQPAASDSPQPSIRIASVDVGGGTTDLMITTYYADGKYAILPVQTFRESFRVAGDDILKAIIEQVLVPQIERQLSASGVPDARELLNSKFGGNRANMSEREKHLRQQFVLRVLRPIAIELLRSFEATDITAQETTITKTIGMMIAEGSVSPISLRVQEYLSASSPGFGLHDVGIDHDYRKISEAVSRVLDNIFDNISEVLNHFDCDVVLLAGRPSRLPATVDLLVNKLAVPPDRVLPLHEYRVGAWYPFKTRDNVRISDPKTATVVGGMLCALAERKIMNLTIFTDRLTLKSTARYIGQLNGDGSLPQENVLFSLGNEPATEVDAEIRYDAPMRLGFRQLPFKRWTANPLYKLSLPAGQPARLPITVTLQRGAPDEEVGFEEMNKFQKGEARKEEVRVLEAFDANGASVSKIMQLTFDTMTADEGYWLDTGILTIH